MTSEEYGQYIDDFELGADVMPGESLTEYIERRRREFESKADGGSIGIEVLFKEKMKDGGRAGFFMGGPALEGQALQIYNSMNAYGFSDQEIADALSARGLYTPAGSGSETTQPNIIGAQLNQAGGSGGGGITELQETFTREAGSKPKISEDAFFGLGKFLQGKERGTLGTRLANQPRLPLPGAIASYSLSPFNEASRNYNPLLEGQLNFLELGDNLIGRDPNTGGLKYGSGSVLAGKNVISAFGTNNYEQALLDYITKMNTYQTKKKSDARAIKIQKAKDELKALQNKQAQDMRARQADTTRRARELNPDVYAKAEQLGFIDKDTGGFKSAGTNENFSNKTGRGRTGYSEGGLATMFTRRR